MVTEWDKNSAGNIALTPLVSIDAQVWDRRIVGLRLELSRSPAHGPEDPVAVQVGMSPGQALELLVRLQWCLENLEPSPPLSELN